MAYTAIDDPSAYFKVQLHTGDGTAIGAGGQAVVFDDTDTDMSPDLVWIKSRNDVHPGEVYDTVRGVTKRIYTTDADAETTNAEGLNTFGSDGFTVGSQDHVNENTKLFVSYNWLESTTSGLDVVGYTGTGSARTVSHGLGVKPDMISIKRLDAGGTWHAYHQAITADAVIEPDTQVALKDNANFMNDTEPTTSVFTVNVYDEVNASSGDFIAHCFAPKQGFSKMGSYEGNGNADGQFIYTGFRPAFVQLKSVDSTSDWFTFDNKRLGYNVDNNPMLTNASAAVATTDMIDILSNGFKIRIATDPNVAETYIYAAFAEAPFVNSNGVPCNAR